MSRWTAAVDGWGSTATERAAAYPCDKFLPQPEAVLHRAVDVDAPADMTFRWLCQLRVAPYSYDWIDNWGRRSPRELTPGLEAVEPGQKAMTIFRIVDVEPGRSLTFLTNGRLFGKVACTYEATPNRDDRSRIVVKLAVVYPRSFTGAVTRRGLPAGDLVMMRKQLLTLKRFAERDAVRVSGGDSSGR